MDYDGKITKVSTKTDRLGVLVATVSFEIELDDPARGTDLMELQSGGGKVSISLNERSETVPSGYESPEVVAARRKRMENFQ